MRRAIHYMNVEDDITACDKRLTRMTLTTMLADQVTCPKCRDVMELYPF